MSTRLLTYPDQYGAAVITGGDIRLRFNAPGSKFGPVEVVLAGDDAEMLAKELDKAIVKSWATRRGASNTGKEPS